MPRFIHAAAVLFAATAADASGDASGAAPPPCGSACYDFTGSLTGTAHQCTCDPSHCVKSTCEDGGGLFIEDNCEAARPCSCSCSPSSAAAAHAPVDAHRQLQLGTETAPGCTGSLEPWASGNGGSFELDGGYGTHTDDCTYLLDCAGAGLSPVVDWSRFDTEDAFDYVELHDGSSADASVVARYHGEVVPPPSQASGQSLFLQLQSDSSIAGNGFAGSWTCQPWLA
jgi:hypothetical protein